MLSGVAVFSGFVGACFHQELSNNPDAVNTIVTIFSILAGFLIAVITFTSAPPPHGEKDGMKIRHMQQHIRPKLRRYELLFYAYLITLGIALTMYLVPQSWSETHKWIQIGFLSLATLVFLTSFTLPSLLINTQMERYDEAFKNSLPQVLRDADRETEEEARRDSS